MFPYVIFDSVWQRISSVTRMRNMIKEDIVLAVSTLRISTATASSLFSLQVTQMVHDPREQVLPQRFEDLRQNGPSGVGDTQLPPTSTGSSIDGHHPNCRLTSPGPPRLSSLLFGTTALFGGTTSLFGFITLFRITHIKDLNFVLLSVTRDKLAEDTVTQTKVQPVATWKCNQPLQRAKVVATRKFDASSTKGPHSKKH
ncbi:hypothetical protein KIN20_023741 [Parelaphostrongylus tenuis]|uniref:Transmembrane protein n=1 Tax=Parelaphostrongylus tenuis TaxID=148309 RepID=A0AAD5MXD1_PARTN|nr:hypothetical protein KIN20_023741 [Parelaphostrongylus tenuis]